MRSSLNIRCSECHVGVRQLHDGYHELHADISPRSSLKRRSVIKYSLALLIAPVVGCSSQPQKPTSVEVDVSGVDTVPKLIEAIKKAGGPWRADTTPDTHFIKEFARTFVQNARAAAQKGFKIPQWVLDKLPARKVAFPVLGLMIFNAYGINFVIPVGTVVTAVLGSFALMTTAVIAAVREILQPNTTI